MNLSARISAGGTITEEEYASLQQLSEYAVRLQESLKTADPDFSSGSTDNFKDTSDEFTDYPTLIYDGPFSDHIAQRQPAFLEGGRRRFRRAMRRKMPPIFSESNRTSSGMTAIRKETFATYNFFRRDTADYRFPPWRICRLADRFA